MEGLLKESKEYEEFRLYMQEGMKSIGLMLGEDKLEKFYIFYRMLIEKNKVMNLTAITELKEVVYKHFVDSLSLVKLFPEIAEKNISIIDMGTGAGFPGIPIAIAWKNVDIFLIDSLNKRISFINEVKNSLNLNNLSAEHGRAEDLARKNQYRECFDLCVSRAVANLSTLSEYCLPFIHRDGIFIPYKSRAIDEEIESASEALKILGGKIEKTERFEIYGEERALILIRKTGICNKKYPRKAGLPSKEPLGVK